jgi:hypothetical protein
VAGTERVFHPVKACWAADWTIKLPTAPELLLYMAIRSWVLGSAAKSITESDVTVAASVRGKILPSSISPVIPAPFVLPVDPNIPKPGAQGGVEVGLGVKVLWGVQVGVGAASAPQL